MCDPISIAGAVLMAASTAVNMIADGQVAAARADALNAERIRQDGYNREAEALNDTSRDRFQDFGGKRGDRAEQLADYFSPANSNTGKDGIIPASDSSITVANEKGQHANAGTDTKQQSDALANLRSFADLFGDATRGQAGDAARIGMVGSFKRGSQAIVPLELEEANKAGDGLKMFGTLLGGAGKLGVSAGLGGAKIPSLGGMGTSGAAAP